MKKGITRRSAKEVIQAKSKIALSEKIEEGGDGMKARAELLREIANEMDWHDIRKNLETWIHSFEVKWG